MTELNDKILDDKGTVLKDKVIIILGNTRFDSEIQATSLFIARHLSEDNKVFFVDYPFTFKDYFKYRKANKYDKRSNQFSCFSDGLIDTDLPNLKIVITPPVLPINFLPEGIIFRLLLKINEFVIGTRLKKILKKERATKFIYMNSFNFHYPNIANHIKPTLTIYHCVDPMIVPYDMKHGIKSEGQLVKNSDLVICTSKALYNEKVLQNKNTYFVPNGTDSGQTAEKSTPTLKIHEKVKGLPKPIVGYLGTIERRIDYDLIYKIILANPDKTFILAGPVTDNYIPEHFYKINNLHILGAIPYDEVPQMINSFDVAIIPFKKDSVSDTIFPIKLFEYLSAGKPVICTDFNPDLKDFTNDMVKYCNDANLFSEAINEAIISDSISKIQNRKNLAKENTWKKRADNIGKIINPYLK
jgi:teichuronic acid biosynthesis glycosyltransferase TuaH